MQKTKYRDFSLNDLEYYDLVSETILAFLKNNYKLLKNIKRDRDEKKSSLRGLMATILHRKFADRIKDNKKNCFAKIDDELIETYDKDILLEIDLQNVLDKMESERGIIYKSFILYYLENYKVAEIANKLGVAESAVKYRLYAGRKWFADNF